MLNDLRPELAVFGNGLRALALPVPHVHRAVLTFCLDTGSRFESGAVPGISHFVEHMLFRGTATHPTAHALATAFEDLGGTLVASTAADHGNLAIGVPVENLELAIERLVEVVHAPLLGGIEFERGIIREEILEDLNDDGDWIDGATLLRTCSFGDHGLGRSITGSIEDIETITDAHVRAHHARTYVGRRSVVAVAGPIDAARLLTELERGFGVLAPGEVPELVAPPEEVTARYRFVRHRGSGQTALHVGFRSAGDHDPAEPALEMLLRVIDDGMATRLYHRLCDSSGLCYDAGASYEAYAETGLIEFSTETAHERAARVLGEIGRLTDELAADGPTTAELERARRRAQWHHEAMLDSSGELADFVAMAELKETARTPKARLDQLLSVTRDDVHAAATRFFGARGRSVVAVGNPKPAVTSELERLALSP